MTDTSTVGLSLSFGEMLRRDRQNRAPDVLNTIANLSSDEVFTSPEFANKMLDSVAEAWSDDHEGESMWADPHITFLDPATKSGVFLREITKRLMEAQGNPTEGSPERKALLDQVLTKQVFGIGMTTLTSLLARRSIYCSKDATSTHSVAPSFTNSDGNIWFERTEHEWVGRKKERRVDPLSDAEVTVELESTGKCKWCGATERALGRAGDLETHAYKFIHAEDPKKVVAELFGADMQFDVIIGNPPYQLDDGGEGMSASPIYQHFVEQAKRLEPRYLSMVIPSRWMAGGKGLDGFRKSMFEDRHIRTLVDYPDASDVFGSGIKVKGGVCYFVRDEANTGATKVTTVRGGNVSGPLERALDEYDVFIRDVEAVEILKKVRSKNEASVREMFGGDFGFDTNFSEFDEEKRTGDLTIQVNIGGMGHKRAVRFISQTQVKRSTDLIDAWKVFAPKAAGYGSQQIPDRVLGRPIVAGPGEVCTRTYRVAAPLDSEKAAVSFESYYLTKFFRFLVMLRKITQDAAPKVYTWVPQQTWDRSWTDEDLYAKYSLTADEIEYVESVIRPLQSGTASSELEDED